MISYNAPLYWFGPQALRRWLWVNRGSLSSETVEELRELVAQNEDPVDIHSVIQNVILTTDFAEILNCLHRDEFREFVDDTLDYRQQQIEREYPACTVIIGDSYARIRRKLRESYTQFNIRPRSSVSGLTLEIEKAVSEIRSNLDLAVLPGVMQIQAQAKLRNGCDTVLERIEKILDLMLDFMTRLVQLCGETAILSGDNRWGPKELELHNIVSRILRKTIANDWPDEIRHLLASIRNFASLWYGTDIKHKKRTSIWISRETEYPVGQAMSSLGSFREWRNDVSHPTNTLQWQDGLPRSLIEVARHIIHEANKFTSSLYTFGYFPELVHIASYEFGINGHEFRVIAVPNSREYVIVYHDEEAMQKLAHDAMNSIACTDGDQDFWLFPTYIDYETRILNPVMLPCGNHKDYEQFIRLEIETFASTQNGSPDQEFDMIPV